MVYMYHSFLIHSSADGHLGCFHVLAIINSAPMNIGVHVSLSDLVSLVCMPRSGIAGSYFIWMHVRHSTKDVTYCIIYFCPEPVGCVVSFVPFIIWGNFGFWMLSGIPRVTHRYSGRPRIWHQISKTLNKCHGSWQITNPVIVHQVLGKWSVLAENRWKLCSSRSFAEHLNNCLMSPLFHLLMGILVYTW